MSWTPFLITVLVIGLTIYDLIMVVFFGTKRSISRFVNVTFFKAPVVAFGCGFLCGHFCGYMEPPTEEEMEMIPIPIVIEEEKPIIANISNKKEN